ncbi:MAG: TIGR01212 family radical SAM protein [Myxococcota bacterium]
MSKFIFLSDYLKSRFGFRVHKVSFRIGNSCPNRDGTISKGGCIFCNGAELIPFSYRRGMTPVEQIEAGIEIVKRKYKAEGFIAYLQDNTATYGDEGLIMNSIRDVLSVKGVVGVSLGTRADCISERFFKFFEEISRETLLMVEIGVQSVNEETLKRINRGHSVKVMEDTFLRLALSHNIHTVAHIILGLLDEGEEDVINIARWLNRYKVDGVKIHNIVVLRDTPLSEMYFDNRFIPPDRSTLLRFYKILFQNLKDDIVIHRLTTDASDEFIIAPDYARHKGLLIREIKRVLDESVSNIS